MELELSGAPGTLIGGTSDGARNIISGNAGVGVSIYGTGAVDTLVQGNWIGLDGLGKGDLGNAFQGIYAGDGQAYGVAGYSSNTTIGGQTSGAGNVVSGNNQNGIWISGIGATGNTIQGNLVGTDATGTLDVGNSFHHFPQKHRFRVSYALVDRLVPCRAASVGQSSSYASLHLTHTKGKESCSTHYSRRLRA